MISRPNQMSAPGPKEAPAGPSADLTREGDSLVLVVSLPGVRAGDFRISLVGNRQVYIEGAVPYRHPAPAESLALAERQYGPFSRTIHLPLPVDPGRVAVQFERGILKARLPLQMQRIPLHQDQTEGDRHAKPR